MAKPKTQIIRPKGIKLNTTMETPEVRIETGQGVVESSGESVTRDDVDDLIKRIDITADKLKREFITIFGLFAGLVTFLATEIQIFKRQDSFSLFVGQSALLVASILSFSVLIFYIIERDSSRYWRRLVPVIGVIAAFFVISATAFYWAATGTFWNAILIHK